MVVATAHEAYLQQMRGKRTDTLEQAAQRRQNPDSFPYFQATASYLRTDRGGPWWARRVMGREVLSKQIESGYYLDRSVEGRSIIDPHIRDLDSTESEWVNRRIEGALLADPRLKGIRMRVGWSDPQRTWFNWRGAGCWLAWAAVWLGVPLVLVLLGLELYMLSRRRVVAAGLCPRCRYALRAMSVARCPECGEHLSTHEQTILAAMLPGSVSQE
jgi:hypothetical protein